VEVPTYTFHKLALEILKENNVKYSIADSNLLSYIIDEFFLSECFGNDILKNIVYRIFHIYFFKNEKKWDEIINSRGLVSLKKTIITFISLMKSNGYDINSFDKFFDKYNFRKLLLIIYAIYSIYEVEKVSSGLLDFDDMMSSAIMFLKNNGTKLPFKLFIIDEFQDTSLIRFNLIKELVKINDAGLCVVGDDYQSIYHFSGCDLEIFLNFNDYYSDAKIYRLEKTYRNSLELVNTAGNFIMKNQNQIKKNLVSPKRLDKPINLVYFNSIDSVLERVINSIPKDKEILIISRNNFDIKKYTKYLKYEIKDNNYIEFEKFKNRKIRFMSIHSSKGLESDVVILLNVSNDLYGLPIKLKDEKILSLVKKNQPYPYEEERRLFYVALTRAKNKLILTGTYDIEDYSLQDCQDFYKGKSYFDWIVMSLSSSERKSINSNEIFENDLAKFVKVDEVQDLQFVDRENLIVEEDEVLTSKINDYLNFVYKNINLSKVEFKNSVTGLLKLEIDDKPELQDYQVYSQSQLQGFTASEIGTIYHEVLKNIEFSQIKNIEDLKTNLQTLIETGFISLQEKNVLDIDILYKDIQILQKLTKNKQVYKEKPFIMKLKLNEISNINSTDCVLVQGVVDMFAFGDENILVDYKYTNINNPQKLLEKYSKQLILYSKAIEKGYKIKLNKKYIFSIKNGQLIEFFE